MDDPAPRAEEIVAQLKRIVESPHFMHSARLSRFLTYAVERTVAGRPQDLKEYSIGVEVYDRKPPYHPNEDSIVRTEARRLRTKLKQYYESDGKHDRIQFYFRLGSYVPVFRTVDAGAPEEPNATTGDPAQGQAAGVLFVVFPFADGSGTALTSSFAHALTDEVIHWMMRTKGCRAIAFSTLQHLLGTKLDAVSIAQVLGAQVALEGTVQENGGRIRVTCTFVSLPGLERWSERLEGTASPHLFFELEEQMARAMVARFAPQSSQIIRRRRNPRPQEVAYFPDLLAGESLLDQGDKASIHHALEKFGRIEREQPLCARASCGIAQGYYSLAMLGEPVAASVPADSLHAANRALHIDADMLEAHAARGCALILHRDWSGAEKNFRSAIRLGSYAPAHRLYGEMLTSRGRFDEAFQALQHAQEIDPFSYRQKLAYSQFFYMSRRYEDALAYCSERARYGPTSPDILLFEALTHIAMGKTQNALAVTDRMLQSASGAMPILAEVCGIFALSGDRTKAGTLRDSHRLLDAATPICAARKALLALAFQDLSRAEQYFKQAFHSGEADICWLGVDPRCDAVAKMSYFKLLLRDAPVSDPGHHSDLPFSI